MMMRLAIHIICKGETKEIKKKFLQYDCLSDDVRFSSGVLDLLGKCQMMSDNVR